MNTSVSLLKVVILSILSLALLSGWAFLALMTRSYKNELAVIEAEARDKSVKSSFLISVKNALRDSKAELEEIDSRFIAEGDVPSFISMLEDRASGAGVKADFTITPKDAKSIALRMAGTGTWDRVMKFVSELESIPYASKIESFNLQKADGAADLRAETNWNYTVVLLQYLDAFNVETTKP